MKKSSIAFKLLTVACILVLGTIFMGSQCPPKSGGGGGGGSNTPDNTEFDILLNGVSIFPAGISEVFPACADEQVTRELTVVVTKGTLDWEIGDTPDWLLVNPRSGQAKPGEPATFWITIDSGLLACPELGTAFLNVYDESKDGVGDVAEYWLIAAVTANRSDQNLGRIQSDVLAIPPNELEDQKFLDLNCLDLNNGFKRVTVTNNAVAGSMDLENLMVVSNAPDWLLLYPDEGFVPNELPKSSLFTSINLPDLAVGQSVNFWILTRWWGGADCLSGLECDRTYQASVDIISYTADNSPQDIDVTIGIHGPLARTIEMLPNKDIEEEYNEANDDCGVEDLDPVTQDFGCRPGDEANCFTYFDIYNSQDNSRELIFKLEKTDTWMQFCLGAYDSTPLSTSGDGQYHDNFPATALMDPALTGDSRAVGYMDASDQLNCTQWYNTLSDLVSNPDPASECASHYVVRVYARLGMPGGSNPSVGLPDGLYSWNTPTMVGAEDDTYSMDIVASDQLGTGSDSVTVNYDVSGLDNTCDDATSWDLWDNTATGMIQYMNDVDVFDISSSDVYEGVWLSMLADALSDSSGMDMDPVIYLLDSSCNQWGTYQYGTTGMVYAPARNNTYDMSNFYDVDPPAYWTTSWAWRATSARLHPGMGSSGPAVITNDQIYEPTENEMPMYLLVTSAQEDWGCADTNYVLHGNYGFDTRNQYWDGSDWVDTDCQGGTGDPGPAGLWGDGFPSYYDAYSMNPADLRDNFGWANPLPSVQRDDILCMPGDPTIEEAYRCDLLGCLNDPNSSNCGATITMPESGEIWFSFYYPERWVPITIDIDAMCGTPQAVDGSMMDLKLELYDDQGQIIREDNDGNITPPFTYPDPYIENIYLLDGNNEPRGKFYIKVSFQGTPSELEDAKSNGSPEDEFMMRVLFNGGDAQCLPYGCSLP